MLYAFIFCSYRGTSRAAAQVNLLLGMAAAHIMYYAAAVGTRRRANENPSVSAHNRRNNSTRFNVVFSRAYRAISFAKLFIVS